jgi:hypothetical protein
MWNKIVDAQPADGQVCLITAPRWKDEPDRGRYEVMCFNMAEYAFRPTFPSVGGWYYIEDHKDLLWMLIREPCK